MGEVLPIRIEGVFAQNANSVVVGYKSPRQSVSVGFDDDFVQIMRHGFFGASWYYKANAGNSA